MEKVHKSFVKNDTSDLIGQEINKTFTNLERENTFSHKLSVDDFFIIKLIGKGAYGKVFLVRKKNSEEVYAMKTLKKREMILKDQVLHIKTEKKIMEIVDHPFIIKLRHAFQNQQKLYLVTNFCPGGELYYHLSRLGSFNETSVKFYAAQIVLALEHLHSKNIIYRDLKPENIIIDKDGYIKLTDFGLAKEIDVDSNRTYSFCGTPEYFAPEIIERIPYNKDVDWWSFGVIIFEMLTGRPPFSNSNRNKLFNSILNVNLKLPNNLSTNAESILKQLLVKKKRLGSEGVQDIKNHSFFQEINWNSILNKKIKPPFIPCLRSPFDTKYVEEEFLDEPAVDSYNKGDTIESKDDLFKDFSFDFNFFDNVKTKCLSNEFEVKLSMNL